MSLVCKIFLSLMICIGLLSVGTFTYASEQDVVKEEITHIASFDLFYSGQMIAVGDEETWEEIQQLIQDNLSYICGYNEKGGEALLEVSQLDVSTVNIEVVGTYVIKVVLDISEEYSDGYFLSPEITEIEVPVKVSNPEEFELWKARTIESKHIIYYLPDIIPSETQIYFYESETKIYLEDSKNLTWKLCDDTIAMMKGFSFAINRDALIKQHYAYFYLQNGDMRSQIIEVYENGVFYSVETIGGDRDGGDTNLGSDKPFTQPIPDLILEETEPKETFVESEFTQPPVENEQSIYTSTSETEMLNTEETRNIIKVDPINQSYSVGAVAETTLDLEEKTSETETQSSNNGMEYSDNDKDIFSGYRTRLLMESGGCSAKFSKHGITVEIPQDVLAFQDDDIITVEIIPDNNSATYHINISINEKNVVLENAVTIWFPESFFQGIDTTEITVNNSNQPLIYDSESKAFYLVTTELGEFVLISDSKDAIAYTSDTPQNHKSNFNIIIIVGVVLLITIIAVGMIFYWRKRIK